MAKKRMSITLREDFMVPTDDGNIIFEPGDEIEVEYEEDSEFDSDDVVSDDDFEDLETGVVTDTYEDSVMEDPDDIVSGTDPLTFAGNGMTAYDDNITDTYGEEYSFDDVDDLENDEEVYIEDPTYDLV